MSTKTPITIQSFNLDAFCDGRKESKEYFKSTFRKTGIYPIDRGAITPDLLIGDTPQSKRESANDTDGTSLIMEVCDESSDIEQAGSNQRATSSATVEVQTDPPACLPCPECVQNDVNLHPAVAAGVVSLDLAKVLIPDSGSALKNKENRVRRQKERKQRWLTGPDEAEKRCLLREKEENIQNEKEQRKQERENAKQERQRQIETKKAESLLKKAKRREINEAKTLAKKARIVANQCKSCKKPENDDILP